jgi:hypothetical protein
MLSYALVACGLFILFAMVRLRFWPGMRKENPRSMCFRISGLPPSWSQGDVLGALCAIDPSLISQKNLRLSLYPSVGCGAPTQTALLNLDSGTEKLQLRHHLTVPESGAVLTIDSHFHDLTPLNAPEGKVIAELVVAHAYQSRFQMLILYLL